MTSRTTRPPSRNSSRLAGSTSTPSLSVGTIPERTPGAATIASTRSSLLSPSNNAGMSSIASLLSPNVGRVIRGGAAPSTTPARSNPTLRPTPRAAKRDTFSAE
jgi:hypothetical protein